MGLAIRQAHFHVYGPLFGREYYRPAGLRLAGAPALATSVDHPVVAGSAAAGVPWVTLIGTPDFFGAVVAAAIFAAAGSGGA